MDFEVRPFILVVTLNDKAYSFQISQTYLSGTKEIFTLIYGSKSLQMQSNRPLIRGMNLNKKRIGWKAINGEVKYGSSLEKIKQELESYIKKIEKPSLDWDSLPKNQPY